MTKRIEDDGEKIKEMDRVKEEEMRKMEKRCVKMEKTHQLEKKENSTQLEQLFSKLKTSTMKNEQLEDALAKVNDAL